MDHEERTMTRLIDADALVEDFEKVYEFYMNEIKEANENPDNYTSKFIPATAGVIDGIVEAEIAINNAPTIEPTGVIRCKDCKYWQDNNGGYPNPDCRWNEQETPDADDFCSFAERREP